MDKAGKEKPYLPDEIIRNILIRLPAKSLFRFQLVCKEWRYIILGREFMDLHRSSSNPVVIVASGSKSKKLFAIDKWWDLSRKKTMIHRFPSFTSGFSYADISPFSHSGLIVLNKSRFWNPEEPSFIILNPARPSDECVKIKYSDAFLGDICAVYYHPILEEYCALWRILIPGSSADEPDLNQYRVLNLGSNPSFKMICDAFTYRFKDADRLVYPLFINNHLYWMLESEEGDNDILQFDIISEEFNVIPCPIPLSTECSCDDTHLLTSEGNLSFLLILSSSVTISVLKDHELQLWTTTKYTISVDTDYRVCFGDVIIALANCMLAFQRDRRIFVCNLREGTVKKYPKSCGGYMVLSHQICLHSLKNCKDGLYIDKYGELFV